MKKTTPIIISLKYTNVKYSYDFVRENLELYQKYAEQHPETYNRNGIKIVFRLPASITQYKNMFSWFIPFSMKLNITIEFEKNYEQLTEQERFLFNENIEKLSEIGVKISI